MRKQGQERRIALEERQDVEAILPCTRARDNDPSRRQAAEVGDRLRDDPPAEIDEAPVTPSATLVGDNRAHHPEAIVARRVCEAALNHDRPGKCRIGRDEADALARTDAVHRPNKVLARRRLAPD